MNLHFDNEGDIHGSSGNYEANGYSLNLDLNFGNHLVFINSMYHILGEVG